jgi:hypothetical protein
MEDRVPGRQQQRQQHRWIAAAGGELRRRGTPRSQTPTNGFELRKQSLKTGAGHLCHGGSPPGHGIREGSQADAWAYCIESTSPVPLADELLAIKLLLEIDEPRFLATAHR